MDGIILYVLYARQRWNQSKEFYGVIVVNMSRNLQLQGKQKKKICKFTKTHNIWNSTNNFLIQIAIGYKSK